MRAPVLMCVVFFAVGCDDDAKRTGPVTMIPSGNEPLGELILSPKPDKIAGTFVATDQRGVVTIEFSSDTDANGRTSARYSTPGGAALDVSLDGDIGSVLWNGKVIDGRGVLSVEEAAAIEEIGTSELIRAIVAVPLEIGCRTDDDDTSPPQRAALLLPWQLLIKYSATFADTRVAAAHASCTYFQSHEVSADPSVLPTPGPRALMMSNGDEVPHIMGIFPLDAEGAVSNTLGAHVGGATICMAQCRGTCGADCPTTNCTSTFFTVCEVNGAGAFTGLKRVIRRYSCGSHSGCRDHHACYDSCNSSYGCGSWGPTFCRRGCDSACLAVWGTAQCSAWAYGYPRYDSTVTYDHDIYGYGISDPVMCPIPMVDMAMSLPDLAMTLPDMAMSMPDMAMTLPDMATSMPDIGTFQPDMGTFQPDMAQPSTDAAIPQSDLAVPAPDAAIPDATMTFPDLALNGG